MSINQSESTSFSNSHDSQNIHHLINPFQEKCYASNFISDADVNGIPISDKHKEFLIQNVSFAAHFQAVFPEVHRPPIQDPASLRLPIGQSIESKTLLEKNKSFLGSSYYLENEVVQYYPHLEKDVKSKYLSSKEHKRSIKFSGNRNNPIIISSPNPSAKRSINQSEAENLPVETSSQAHISKNIEISTSAPRKRKSIDPLGPIYLNVSVSSPSVQSLMDIEVEPPDFIDPVESPTDPNFLNQSYPSAINATNYQQRYDIRDIRTNYANRNAYLKSFHFPQA